MAAMDALLGQLFQGFSPAALAWYRDRTGITQKLCRLDMLVTKIHSVVEVSEKAEITSESLRSLQQKFKAAATEGDEVLHKLQDQVNSSSSSPSGIRTLFDKFISRQEDVEKLNSTIRSLEDISSHHVKDFLKTLKLELQLADQMRILKQGSRIEKKECEKPEKKEEKKAETKAKHEKKEDKKDGDKKDEKKEFMSYKWYGEDHMTFWPPYPHPAGFIDPHRRFPQFVYPFSEEYALKRAFPEWLGSNTFRAPKRNRALPRFPANSNNGHSDSDLEESEKVDKHDNSLISGASDSFKGKGKLVPPGPLRLLPRREVEDVSAVERLAARIQRNAHRAKQKGEAGSWFGRWIAKLEEAAKEGNAVASAIKSDEYYVDEQISDEVGVIVAAARHRLEIMSSDLEDFSNLAEVEKLARELTSHGSNAPIN